MANKDVKDYAKQKQVCLWQLAKALNISVETFTRRFREELPNEEKRKMKAIIDGLEKVEK